MKGHFGGLPLSQLGYKSFTHGLSAPPIWRRNNSGVLWQMQGVWRQKAWVPELSGMSTWGLLALQPGKCHSPLQLSEGVRLALAGLSFRLVFPSSPAADTMAVRCAGCSLGPT